MGDTKVRRMLGTVAVVLALGGSWTAAEELGPVSAPLEPMEKPTLTVGATKTWQNRKGGEWDVELVAADETTATYQTSSGCIRTTLHEEFSQAVKWQDCGQESGKGTTSLVSGEIWPLKKGNKWRYRYAGSNNKGDRWRGNMRCSVKDEVRVSVPAGEYDTFHLVCKTKNVTRDYYISPEIGTNVMYKAKHRKARWPSRTYKLVSFTPGSSG